MVRIGVKFRAIAVYILKVGDNVALEKELTKRVPKLTFKWASKSKVDNKKQNQACGLQNSSDPLNDHNP